ncbi:MAG: glycosyltransferase family 4 protein [Acidimicrobiales bacterium]|jgi:glycosyltransferase involved in cell wall biosynthesis|nr:glycosyltransferase family 4 protein [Acidimicrobiales bacterium]
MKVAVYNQWWATAGGGEKFAGGIAQELAVEHDVTLLTHEELDLDALGERLQLDLGRVAQRGIDLGAPAVTEASEDYDLLVNASYHSIAPNAARHGLYVVHFPNPPVEEPPGWKREAKRVLRPLVAMPGVEVSMVRGFHPEELIAGHRAQWTTGSATVEVRLPAGTVRDVHVRLGRFLGAGLPPVPVTLSVDGRRAATLLLRPVTSRFERPVLDVTLTAEGHDDGTPVRIRIDSDVHVPAEVFGTNDDRRLGVPVVGAQVGDRLKARLRRRYPSLTRGPVGFDWVRTYDRVVSNSQYTRDWVRRWWEVDTAVLNPPVTLQTPGEKAPIILHVGRFFAAREGHSKKQLELVKAFRALVERGHAPGWELHLVGGCSAADRPYLDKVLAEAEDLPLVLHIDAPGAELRDLYGRASIYWHATGLGEDDRAVPDRFEHFGITTVEAMSAGAVPVVIAKAGQLEVVEHGVSGYHFDSLAQLVRFTEQLVGDDDRRTAMAGAARERAAGYGMVPFGERVRDLVRALADDPIETEAEPVAAPPTGRRGPDAGASPVPEPPLEP